MRQCLFCDRVASTREHVFPDWILSKLSPRNIQGVIGRIPIKHFGPNPAIKHRCVCRECNNGWMNDLEIANQKLISPLMHGVAIPLDLPQQFTISLWAVKTAIVWESVVSKYKLGHYSEEQRHALRSTSAIPPYTHVWLGRYTGNFVLGMNTQASRHRKIDENLIIDGYTCTLLVGKLALQVHTIHLPGDRGNEFLALFEKDAPWERLLIQTYPSEGRTSWPPVDSFSDLQLLAERWSLGEEKPLSGT